MTFVEAQVAKVTGRWSLRRFPVQQAEIRETIREIVADVLRVTARYTGGPIAVRPGRWKSVPDSRQQFALKREESLNGNWKSVADVAST